MKKSGLLVLLSCACLMLSGCIFVAGAAAGAAAIAVVNDHRTLQNAWQDTRIGNRITTQLRQEPGLGTDSHVEVSVFNRVVLLTGETPRAQWKIRAGDIAGSVKGVSRVYNQIIIQGPTSPLTRTSDSWITAKIKTEMLATENLRSTGIKVVTENGIVYLMGAVSHEQANKAVNIARRVSGVQKVIKIFQYKQK